MTDLKQKFVKYREIATRAHGDEEFRKSLNLEKYFQRARELRQVQVDLPPDKLRIAILGYVVTAMDPWDPANVLTGLPGSEECAVYGAAELARRGHQVTVYMNPPKQSIWKAPFSNPRWLPVDMWKVSENTERYDLVLMWRNFDFKVGYQRARKVFFWPHDSPQPAPSGKKFLFPPCDGVCILSKHHWQQYARAFQGFHSIPFNVAGNGFLLEQFPTPVRATNPYSMGYFSNYARGLVVLMVLWPQIRQRFPRATLDICYGRETWGSMPAQQLEFVIQKITAYQDQGVTEHGKVGHQRLADIMQRTSIWAYPCPIMGTCETFCITAVKCQAAGMIPVTTRVGALAETVHPEAPHIEGINSDADVPKYGNLLFQQLERIGKADPEELIPERQQYIQYASQFTWQHCVDRWLALYQKVTN